mgnify:CR=1 FL=1
MSAVAPFPLPEIFVRDTLVYVFAAYPDPACEIVPWIPSTSNEISAPDPVPPVKKEVNEPTAKPLPTV